MKIEKIHWHHRVKKIRKACWQHKVNQMWVAQLAPSSRLTARKHVLKEQGLKQIRKALTSQDSEDMKSTVSGRTRLKR